MESVTTSGARRRLAALLAAAGLLVSVAGPSAATPLPPPVGPTPNLAAVAIKLVPVATGLNRPVFVTPAPDGSGRLFIVEQSGKIKILASGSVLGTAFLNETRAGPATGEQGLLGLAFHPDFATNRRLFINYTNDDGNSVIREYRASGSNPNVVDPASTRVILRQHQPYVNHNGGMLAFSKGGYLFIGFGDGGGSGDPANRAQRLDTLLGKILRIDVDGTTATKNYRIPPSNPYVGRSGRNEIWQRGLRNPWRFTFDRDTWDLWIGDVGQGEWEEIDRVRQTSSGPGKAVNWGWDVLEGSHCYSPPSGCNTSGKKYPLLDYSHAAGRCSVTGGYVYRGSAIPGLVGRYLFADYCSGEIWSVGANASRPASKTLLLDMPFRISSFGQDDAGELYVLDHNNGRVLRIEPA
jgi:glucose/arabinose dehydrogenase